MTKPVSRKMAVDCLLWMAGLAMITNEDPLKRDSIFHCIECHEPVFPEQAIQFDHRHAIVHDGPHEYKNLWPVHTECHKKKTARDVAANAKVKRLTGQTKGRPKRKWAKQKMKSGKTKWPKRSFNRSK